MAKIKVGQVAFVKTTDEPVFVMDMGDWNLEGSGVDMLKDPAELSGTVVKVRRPVQGDDGVRHVKEFFYIEELETQDDKNLRELARRKEMEALFQPKTNEGIQGELFRSN